MRPSVAIAEDDSDLRNALMRGLAEEGFEVSAVASGSELLTDVEQSTPDVLVIDIGLPDSDGRDVCQAVRAHGVQSPVIFLTARGALTDRLAGFHAGGDDYLVKPFEFKELVVRLHALARRSPEREGDEGDPAAVRLDPAAHAAATAHAMVTLTPTEFRLLAALVARPGEVVRRRELMAAGWPDGAIVNANTLDTYVARLRRKLRELQARNEIATVYGVGYRID